MFFVLHLNKRTKQFVCNWILCYIQHCLDHNMVLNGFNSYLNVFYRKGELSQNVPCAPKWNITIACATNHLAEYLHKVSFKCVMKFDVSLRLPEINLEINVHLALKASKCFRTLIFVTWLENNLHFGSIFDLRCRRVSQIN